jgi:methylated-DNA-[protein]-cysteine S-methyltransferase
VLQLVCAISLHYKEVLHVTLETAIKSGKLAEPMNFNQKVWAMTARVPAGQVVTYADIAKALGTRGYRAVGNALNRNPYAPKVPCHRVVGSDGSLTGFAGGIPAKRRLLSREGVRFISENKVDLSARFCFH